MRTDLATGSGPVDVLVVGGGPAGLSAAASAAKAGARVQVLERGAGIGVPVRTSGGSFTRPLRALGLPSSCWHPVTAIRIAGPHRDVVFRYRRALGCVIDVRALYQWLASRAGDAGAALALRSTVTGPLLDGDRVAGVRLRDGSEREARWVVDASGQAGLLARAAGLRTATDERRALGLEAEVYAPRYDQREALLVVGDAVAPGGYGWAFPVGNGRVRLGVGVVRPDSDAELPPLLAGLVERVPALREACAGAVPLEEHAGVMPALPFGSVPFTAPGLLVAGDAAGQGSTLIGEGIRYAIAAGRLAGSVAADAVAAGPQGERLAVARYEREWRAEQGTGMRVAWEVHQRVCRYTDDDWVRVVDLVARLSPGQVARALAGELDGRFAASLLLTRPHVVLGAGRSLLRSSAPFLGRSGGASAKS
ncbi:MAG: 2,3-di-O-geranylgeranylglyceryl phosphate reductase [Mycobacterium sp.]|nr:2,3-di-O-geranylgeranylglyceryl phosphate reductase [Mycobacterium sp.]